MNVLITGEHGYIGSQLCQYLEKNDRFCLHRISLKKDGWQNTDFSQYDAIVHLAGIVHRPKTSEEVYEKVNFALTIALAKIAKKANVKQFLFFSTGSVYGNIKGKITPNTKAVPSNFYGKTKWKAEVELQKMETENFKVAIIRPPMVYGKGCRGNYCTLEKIAQKSPIFPKIENKRSMIYIENLCEFTKLLMENQEAGLFFPQDKEFVNTADMVNLIAAENHHKIWITKFLNPFVYFGKCLPGKIGSLCNKAFGDWYYEKSMSEYKEDYNKRTLEEAIGLIEKM